LCIAGRRTEIVGKMIQVQRETERERENEEGGQNS
jgi:hypothetical protein